MVVVSIEPLGLPLADNPLTPVTDPQADVLRLAVELTVQKAKDTPLAIRTVTTAEVTERSPYKESNVRKLLSSLSSHGLLTKQGEREAGCATGRNDRLQNTIAEAEVSRSPCELSPHAGRRAIRVISGRREVGGRLPTPEKPEE